MADSVDHRGARWQRLLAQVLLIFFSLIFIMPFVWLVTSSVKPDAQIFRSPPEWIPLLPVTHVVAGEECPVYEGPDGSRVALIERLPGEDAVLALFPTDNKFAVVAAAGTFGANDSIRTEHVIDLLAKMDKENPFALALCGHDAVAGTFARAPKGVKKLAEQFVELCPTCLDDEAETVKELAALLKKRKSFFLWWD